MGTGHFLRNSAIPPLLKEYVWVCLGDDNEMDVPHFVELCIQSFVELIKVCGNALHN